MANDRVKAVNDMETIFAKKEELKEYSERTTTSKQSLELAKKVLNLKQQMQYLRTDAKINAIRIKIVEKVATKLAEQACTLAHSNLTIVVMITSTHKLHNRQLSLIWRRQ